MSPRVAKPIGFKAKIVDKTAMRKSEAQLEAEELIGKLTEANAVQIGMNSSSARAVRSAFRKAAKELGTPIAFRKRGARLYVTLKD